MTGDGVPKIVTPDTGGNLRAITISGNPIVTRPAANPITSLGVNSPGKDGWSGYQLTHRGSLTGGKNVDDLLVHKPGDAQLYVYDNPGNFTTGTLDKHETVAKPPATAAARAAPATRTTGQPHWGSPRSATRCAAAWTPAPSSPTAPAW